MKSQFAMGQAAGFLRPDGTRVVVAAGEAARFLLDDVGLDLDGSLRGM